MTKNAASERDMGELRRAKPLVSGSRLNKLPRKDHLQDRVIHRYNVDMESITKNVRDISQPDRLALEQVIGQQLAENQQVIIQICSLDLGPDSAPTETESTQGLPDWCNVYAGLTDEQIEAVERTALQRANLTRTTD